MLKRIFAAVLCGLLWVTGTASAEPLNWLTDYNEALAAAKSQNKPVLMYFTGSDWCGWCVRLDKEVLTKPPFLAASDEWVLLELDFPRNTPLSDTIKKQNASLAEKYEIEGFPTLIFTDAEGNELGRTGYARVRPEAFVAHLKKIANQ